LRSRLAVILHAVHLPVGPGHQHRLALMNGNLHWADLYLKRHLRLSCSSSCWGSAGKRFPSFELGDDMVSDAQCIRNDGQGGIYGPDRGKKTCIRNIEVVDPVGLAVEIEH
jgi:hypothetical protein